MRTPTLLFLCAAALGCTGPATPAGPTFSHDLRPILEQKCVSCHQTGGIGAFRLDDYASAKANAAAIAKAVEDGTMPPFLVEHDGTCGDFVSDETLTAAEKDTLIAWARGTTEEGPAHAFTLPPLPKLEGGRELQTPVFAPVAQGGQLAELDEYRCFNVPHGAAADGFITGYDVRPGNAAIVHHVIGFIVDGNKMSRDGTHTNREVMTSLDGQSPDRAGWPCFGNADDQGLIGLESAPIDWAPGQGIVEYPAGMGVPLASDQLLVVQVHYNLADPATRGSTDSTKVFLRTAPAVERKLVFLLPDGFLQTLFGPQPAMLPPGAASTKYTWKTSAAELGLGQLPYADVVAVMPHMHERGKRLELRWGDASSTDRCGARVDAWDFHWQRMYYYREPVRLTAQSTIEVTCDFDTSTATSPVLPGWGTRNEMCLTLLMVALPAGI